MKETVTLKKKKWWYEITITYKSDGSSYGTTFSFEAYEQLKEIIIREHGRNNRTT